MKIVKTFYHDLNHLDVWSGNEHVKVIYTRVDYVYFLNRRHHGLSHVEVIENVYCWKGEKLI